MLVNFSPLAGAGAQFFDNNGVPLAGGLLYTYFAGTTTPLPTYTSSSGSTANENPIILDSAGRVPEEIWLPNGYATKFVLKTSTDVQIWSKDNIPASPQPPIVNDAGSITYDAGDSVTAGSFIIGQTYVITSIGSTNFLNVGAVSNTVGIYFIATGVGSGSGTANYIRTVQAKLRESVSVKDFGAKGDGVTDDTAAIQAALDSLVLSGTTLYNTPPAKELTVPAGIYIFSSAITIPKNVKIKGEGKNSSIFKSNHTGDGFTTIQPVNTPQAINVQLEDLAIWNTNASNTGGAYVDVTGVYITLRNVQLTGFKYNLILDQSELVDCEFCDFENPITACLWIVNGPEHTPGAGFFYSNRISVKSSQFSSTVGSIGIIDDGGYTHSFVDNNYNGCTNHFRVAGVLGFKISGGEFEGATSSNFIFTNTTYGAGTAVGTGQSVFIGNGALVIATGSNNIFNVTNVGTITLDTLSLQSTATKYIGTAGTGGLFARNIYNLGVGVLFDGKAGTHVEQIVGLNYFNAPTTILQLTSPVQTITQVTGVVNAGISSIIQINNNGTAAYTVAAPINGVEGQRITITDINSSSGVGGVYTWNAAYKLAAWTRPAAGFNRSIDFILKGSNWFEVSRTTADIPN